MAAQRLAASLRTIRGGAPEEWLREVHTRQSQYTINPDQDRLEQEAAWELKMKREHTAINTSAAAAPSTASEVEDDARIRAEREARRARDWEFDGIPTVRRIPLDGETPVAAEEPSLTTGEAAWGGSLPAVSVPHSLAAFYADAARNTILFTTAKATQETLIAEASEAKLSEPAESEPQATPVNNAKQQEPLPTNGEELDTRSVLSEMWPKSSRSAGVYIALAATEQQPASYKAPHISLPRVELRCAPTSGVMEPLFCYPHSPHSSQGQTQSSEPHVISNFPAYADQKVGFPSPPSPRSPGSSAGVGSLE
ncbi:hypothetical protein AB1Y20_013485 [Prymnesium parvum]|uniref:Uncharacterized protein n=1 Tax=Prymnesium parvum TaxID=97485 RepID=A0AB34IHY9_PRYPA